MVRDRHDGLHLIDGRANIMKRPATLGQKQFRVFLAAFLIAAAQLAGWNAFVDHANAADELNVTFGINLINTAKGEYFQVAPRTVTLNKPSAGIQMFSFVATNSWTAGCNVLTDGGAFTAGWCMVTATWTNPAAIIKASFDGGSSDALEIGPDETHWFKLIDNTAASNLCFFGIGAGYKGVNVTIFNRHSD